MEEMYLVQLYLVILWLDASCTVLWYLIRGRLTPGRWSDRNSLCGSDLERMVNAVRLFSRPCAGKHSFLECIMKNIQRPSWAIPEPLALLSSNIPSAINCGFRLQRYHGLSQTYCKDVVICQPGVCRHLSHASKYLRSDAETHEEIVLRWLQRMPRCGEVYQNTALINSSRARPSFLAPCFLFSFNVRWSLWIPA